MYDWHIRESKKGQHSELNEGRPWICWQIPICWQIRKFSESQFTIVGLVKQLTPNISRSLWLWLICRYWKQRWLVDSDIQSGNRLCTNDITALAYSRSEGEIHHGLFDLNCIIKNSDGIKTYFKMMRMEEWRKLSKDLNHSIGYFLCS